MSKKKENFNVTQGITLLLLKQLLLPPNLVFQMILFITDPVNNIGYEDYQAQKNRLDLNKAVFRRSVASVSLFPLRRISTPHKFNLFEVIRVLKHEQMSFVTVTCANSSKECIKKAPTYKKQSAFLQQNDCVRSCSVTSFLLLHAPFVTMQRQNF